ncbi:IPT/TIG domain-containing protein [Kitasatospora aureofaciens]|nr:IPT/TIG domain-containing protein [Kitasatospora aureofaciens]ARF81861.1 hypothetical protein B6264_25880 [Kitasatospora aureofaciens]OEV34777.1 hypothetical protein HS99_0009870 [Kitasatospora aureofaciens]
MTTEQPSLSVVHQVCMTLSALAATSATPRPSGETRTEQTARAVMGINQQLRITTLATKGVWEVAWLALSPDNANMAYIARTIDKSNQFAVVSRGTIGSLPDILEDLDVGTVVPFTPAGSQAIAVSKGAMAAFTQVATMHSPSLSEVGEVLGESVPESAFGSPGTTLVQALKALVEAAPSPPTVFVTGHSLGGCIATMLAPYLRAQAQSWKKIPQFGLVTFAAPTAGLQSFATFVNSVPWVINDHVVNFYDMVPLAWNSLDSAKKWYPDPGPKANPVVTGLIEKINELKKNYEYVQPGTTVSLNTTYQFYDGDLVRSTVADFLGQVAYQHSDPLYLTLVGAPIPPAAPVVHGMTPTFGNSGSSVVITGTGFSPVKLGNHIDFGPIACDPGTVTVNPAGTQITAKVPDGVGLVDVQVTHRLGTSAACPLAQFAYGGPAPVVVSKVDPNVGSALTTVTISGSGFTKDAVVKFNGAVSEHVGFVSDTKLTAKVPRGVDTVNVTVTVGVATSPTSPASEFTHKL